MKGVEDKKNAEIAQLRGEIEAELQAESDIYIKKMVCQIDLRKIIY